MIEQVWLSQSLVNNWAEEWIGKQSAAQAEFVTGEGYMARLPKSATYWATKEIADAFVGLASYRTKDHARQLCVGWESEIAVTEALHRLAASPQDKAALTIRADIYRQALEQVKRALRADTVVATATRKEQAHEG